MSILSKLKKKLAKKKDDKTVYEEPPKEEKEDKHDDKKAKSKFDVKFDVDIKDAKAQAQAQAQTQQQVQKSVNKNENDNTNKNVNINKNENDIKINLDLEGSLGNHTKWGDIYDIQNLVDFYGDNNIVNVDAFIDSFNGDDSINQVFDVVQINQMEDNDFLKNAEVTNKGLFISVQNDVEGGKAKTGDGVGEVGKSVMDSVLNGSASASADAIAAVEAFTQSIVMGANVQLNQATLNVAGKGNVESEDVIL